MGQWESKGGSDHYYTPKYIFDALKCNFDLDVAAPIDRSFCYVPAKKFITENSLDQEWKGFIWMNPPFSGRNGKDLWLNKMYNHGNGIAFIPDRTSAPWWQKHAAKSDCVLFINGKINMIRSDGSEAKQPGNGTCLFGYGENAVEILKQSNLGIIL